MAFKFLLFQKLPPLHLFFFFFFAIYFWKKLGHLSYCIFCNLDFADCIPVVMFYLHFVFEILTPKQHLCGSPQVQSRLPTSSIARGPPIAFAKWKRKVPGASCWSRRMRNMGTRASGGFWQCDGGLCYYLDWAFSLFL